MTMLEAEELLRAERVDPNLYSFGPPRLAECSVLERGDGDWIIYVWEHGQKKFIRTYHDESEAVESFVKEIRELSAWSMASKSRI